jgi:phosphoglycerate dehydrogenase-like enzyme
MPEPIEVLITLPFTEEQLAQLRAISPRLNLQLTRARKPEEIAPEDWLHVEVLYTHRLLPDPGQAPALRWIQFHWAGIDHAIDAPILQQPNLVATTLSGANASKVAEYAVMMLLALGQRLPEIAAYQRRAEWPKERTERLTPLEMRSSTVGIVGYGSIGRHVARLLYGFGATVLACKRDAMHPSDPGYSPEGWGDPNGDYIHRLYPAAALHSMLKICDCVVVCVPLTASTRNLIDSVALMAVKPGALLVDVSRGGVVEPLALMNALRDKRLAAAALDVFPEEPLPADSPLWKLPNVIITPHISGITPHYEERAVVLFAENLRRYVTGQPLLNRFDPELQY